MGGGTRPREAARVLYGSCDVIELDDRARAVLKETEQAFPSGPVAEAAAAAQAGPSGESWNALGTALARVGSRELARRVYEAATELAPDLYKPFANLGNLLSRAGDFAAAVPYLVRATELAPERSGPWISLGQALQSQKEHAEAAQAYERATVVEASAPTFHNLGLCLAALGRFEDALAAFERATAIDPSQFVSHFAAAETTFGLSRLDEMKVHLDNATRTAPDDPDVVANLVRQYQLARFDVEAKAMLFGVLERWPTHGTLMLLLSNVLARYDALEEGEPIYQRAMDLGADNPGPWMQIAKIRARRKDYVAETELLEEARRRFPEVTELKVQVARGLKHTGKIDEAEAMLREILEQKRPCDALCTLASVRLDVGDAVEAMELIREADKPPYDISFTGTLACMVVNYLEDADPAGMRDDIRRWARIATPPNRALDLRERSYEPDRRLRVAYVSPDFRMHSVTRFMEPVLFHHDREAFEIFCYSTTEKPEDAVTERIRAMALTYVDFAHRLPFDVAKRAVEDRIDVIVDLAGWTAENTVEALTHRPAPVQVTYLGFPTTLGLEEIRYRITDALADPEGAEVGYTEELVRLGRCAWAFRPGDDTPDVALPGDRPITFGSFNNLSKVGAATLDLFHGVLERVPGSRLLLKAKQLEQERARRRVHEELERRGVDLTRVQLMPWEASRTGHMSLYEAVDICLDTYPYNGTTTTCEALWMGVPVISLHGRTSASRVGHSLLTACGLGDLAVATREGYYDAAARLAADRGALRDLRRGLRTRLLASELGDVEGLTRALEAAYRQLWVRYIESRA
jgi:protein O-GlcNAc transferase